MSSALRERLGALRARLKGRADNEHEQALIRVTIVSIFFV